MTLEELKRQRDRLCEELITIGGSIMQELEPPNRLVHELDRVRSKLAAVLFLIEDYRQNPPQPEQTV